MEKKQRQANRIMFVIAERGGKFGSDGGQIMRVGLEPSSDHLLWVVSVHKPSSTTVFRYLS